MTGPLTLGTEAATVFKVRGRRYLSRSGALGALAAAWVKDRCECERGSSDDYRVGLDSSYCCKYHDPMRHPALMRRLRQLAAKHFPPSRSPRKSGRAND